MKQISILGSTGSIGTQALDVISRWPEEFSVCALTAGKNIDLLEKQIRAFRPRLAVAIEEQGALELRRRVADTSCRVAWGPEGLEEAASLPQADLALNAIVGVAGLKPTIWALEAGKQLALANKESLVCAGAIVMDLAARKGIRILPVDSEHSAIFQSLGGRPNGEIRRILLTASGGPFFGKSWDELADVTAAEALKHPNWSMGSKITVDSSTMMNKGFEVIEALWLFGLKPEQAEVLVHRESVLHSAVEFEDGCVIGQMSPPDMRLPIQYALTYPRRLPGNWPQLDLFSVGKLTFCPPDRQAFPCLALCEEAARRGGDRGAVINAANEAAAELFLQGKIGYRQIYQLCRQALEDNAFTPAPGLEQIFETDARVRRQTRRLALGD